MNVNPDNTMMFSSPPPSYSEAMSGSSTAIVHSSSEPAFTPPLRDNYTTNPSQETPGALTYTAPWLRPTLPIPDSQTFCPPGAEPLLNIQELIVYPSRGRIFKIKNAQKEVVLEAKMKSLSDCCVCCGPNAYQMGFTIRTINKQEVAYMRSFTDSINWFSADDRHMDITVLPDVPIGSIQTAGSHEYIISNPSTDSVFTLKQKKSFFSVKPHQIFTAGGEEIGCITCCYNGKHRLVLPGNLPVQSKILLLFLTVSLQCDEDSRRESSSSQT